MEIDHTFIAPNANPVPVPVRETNDSTGWLLLVALPGPLTATAPNAFLTSWSPAPM
ncbi:hypothetical protein ABZ938_24300 [Streptomyces sp. NPDC046409]|uniref:hypothetical protein n=1 Tax=Streptomyces sp. NPDC046409 TaxID=3156675 RepID=UPI0033DC6F50